MFTEEQPKRKMLYRDIYISRYEMTYAMPEGFGDIAKPLRYNFSTCDQKVIFEWNF